MQLHDALFLSIVQFIFDFGVWSLDFGFWISDFFIVEEMLLLVRKLVYYLIQMELKLVVML